MDNEKIKTTLEYYDKSRTDRFDKFVQRIDGLVQALKEEEKKEFLKMKRDLLPALKKEDCEQRKGIEHFMSSRILVTSDLRKKVVEEVILKDGLFRDGAFELLFRGSEHDFQASKFHELCYRKNRLFVICKSTTNFIFGCYNHFNWDILHGSYYDVPNCFLYGIGEDGKGPVVRLDPNGESTQHAIYCHNSYGPTMGNGHDLHIANGCHKSLTSYVIGGNYYGQEEDKYILNGGAKNFAVEEYEVYQFK